MGQWICPNCKVVHNCKCKKRTAANNTICCVSCVQAVNESLNNSNNSNITVDSNGNLQPRTRNLRRQFK